MPSRSPEPTRVAILANVPIWTLPGLENLRHNRHYATWLEPLIPAFESVAKEYNLKMHWITMCKETSTDLTHEDYGQTFHLLRRRSMAVQMFSGYFWEIRSIRKLLAEIRPEVVHAWGSEDVYGLAGAFSGIGNRIFTLQGCLNEYLRLLGGSLLFRLQTFYEKPTVLRYVRSTAESPGAASLLKSLNPGLKPSLVDYGVNQDFFDASWSPSNGPELLFLGSVSKRKGIIDLIEIAARSELSHISFKIAGDGELRSELESVSPGNVIWLGKCDRREVIRHLESSWALFMPTYADTGPTVIKEARVVGLPIVTTTGAGASSYVTDTGCGHVVAPGDHDAMAEAILDVCANREQAIQLGALGYDQHLEVLHPKTTAKRFADMYLEAHPPSDIHQVRDR